MAKESLIVGVILARRKLSGPWADVTGTSVWEPRQLLFDQPTVAAGTVLTHNEQETLVFAGTAVITLHPGETAHYRDNLDCSAPSVWVALRSADPVPEVLCVSVNPYEGEGYAESGENIVDRVPLPPQIAGWMAEFFAAHHVEQTFVKRKRDKANPEALARRDGPGRGGWQ